MPNLHTQTVADERHATQAIISTDLKIFLVDTWRFCATVLGMEDAEMAERISERGAAQRVAERWKALSLTS